ncbi:MAG TPA: universal stress protein [Bacteroidales bacterium]|nr:universal stress protein [Bacteroidales bacterium]
MKKIIVAVDFSTGSIHALRYAIAIANKAQSDILMVWVDKTASPESIYSISVEDYRTEAVKRFNDLVDQYQPLLTGGKLEYKLRKGKIYLEIATIAKRQHADLIVMGSHGVSGYEQFWIGSNANRVITNACCPVITVSSKFELKPEIKKIVAPIDHYNNTLLKLPFTADFSRLYQSELHLVGIYATTMKTMNQRIENFLDKARKYLDKVNVPYHIEYIHSTDVTKSTIEYAQSINADLISIMTEQDDNGLLGPCAQQIVNYSPIPILSMHEDDAKKSESSFE